MAHAALSSRREYVYQRLVVDGTRYTTAVNETTDTFDTPRSTIETDISRLPQWVDSLDDELRFQAASRILEIRRNRQHLHRLADAAHDHGDLATELSIRRNIDRSLVDEITVWERMGLLRAASDER
ncbi:hypothetical protein [Halobaculum rarum]|uniref:hypothetical protein n=1 Tax=Halobaculum rarum TaxID=3075122 RepID=UPI0032AF3EA2